VGTWAVRLFSNLGSWISDCHEVNFCVMWYYVLKYIII